MIVISKLIFERFLKTPCSPILLWSSVFVPLWTCDKRFPAAFCGFSAYQWKYPCCEESSCPIVGNIIICWIFSDSKTCAKKLNKHSICYIVTLLPFLSLQRKKCEFYVEPSSIQMLLVSESNSANWKVLFELYLLTRNTSSCNVELLKMKVILSKTKCKRNTTVSTQIHTIFHEAAESSH